MDNGAAPLVFIIQLVFIVWGCIVLSNKNRGWGYYVLVIFFPLIGFIVALCLSKVEKEVPPSNDITNIPPSNDVTNNQP